MGEGIFHSHDNNHSNDEVILIRKSLNTKEQLCINKVGRILLTETKLNDKVFVIDNVYTPTKYEPTFFDAFFFNRKFFKT